MENYYEKLNAKCQEVAKEVINDNSILSDNAEIYLFKILIYYFPCLVSFVLLFNLTSSSS